ncbi:MAG: hypothetical protein IJK30_11760 [Ruminococcus sp.]|nr:hypothetical protein [Ruminococcus sp.]
MDIMIAAAVIIIAIGAALIIAGIVRSRRCIDNDGSFISAVGQITGFRKRLDISLIHFIPIITIKYSPVLRYITADGREMISSSLPFVPKFSKIFKEYYHLYETNTPMEIKYSPEAPRLHYYKSRKGFFVREAVYKAVAGAVIIAMGAFMIWLDIGA